jgi:hypothetical protein
MGVCEWGMTRKPGLAGVMMITQLMSHNPCVIVLTTFFIPLPLQSAMLRKFLQRLPVTTFGLFWLSSLVASLCATWGGDQSLVKC